MMDSQPSTAENTLATGQLLLAKTTLASEYGAYFTAPTTACGNLVNATVGGYYTSLVSAVQTAFNSQRTSEETLITSAISKENSYNTSVLGLSTTYATAEINADYAYCNALINSHASELQTELANKQTLIASELACYRAFSDATFTKETDVVTANANAARRQLVFTESYGNSLLGSLWEGLPGYDFYPNETVQTVSTNPLGLNSATLLERVPISYVTPDDPEDEGPDYWTTINPLNASVLAMVTRSAQLVYDAATEAAYATFMTASMAAYSDGVSDELDAARAEVVAKLGARSTFNTSIMNALDTANASYRAAVGASDLSDAIESYQTAYYQTGGTLNSSVASAFGTFQIGVRQDRLAGVTQSNPFYSAYASDVTWATQTKSLRDQSVTQYNAKQSAYVASVASALKSYGVNVLSSFLTAAGQAFTVSKTHVVQTASIGSTLELADYDAEDARVRSYLTAYVNEAIANATFARDKAQARTTAYAQKLGEVENAVNTAKLHGDPRHIVVKSINESEPGVSLDDLEKLKRQVDRVYATATAADAAFASADEAAIAANEATNQATREAALASADATAKGAKRAVRDDALLDLYAAAATAKGGYMEIADDLDEALATQIAAYNTTIRAANATFSADLKSLDRVFSYYQGEIDLFGGSVPANAYPSEPQLDYEICFVAGTSVLMADGSLRPIESLRPGDVVLATNHLNPESAPAPAKVARFFDNGEKTVVRLVVGAQELICTPEHPFYVVGKGWVRADALAEGDLCLNVRGERVAFVSREAIAGTRRVYNIEVEGAHTYFVGDDDGVLAHNACKECGAAWYNIGHAIYGCPVANARNHEKMQNLGLTALSAVDEVQTHENAEWAEEATIDLASTLPGTDTIMDLSEISNGRELFSYAVKKITFEALIPGVASKIVGNVMSRFSRDISWDVITIQLDKMARFAHYEVRDCLNINKQFDQFQSEIDSKLAELNAARDAANKNKTKEATIELGGVVWQVLPDKAAKYHGKDCFKLIHGRRELVIDRNGKIEKRPEFAGTFNYWPLNLEGGKLNYGVSVVLHGVSDVLPYWLWGNSLHDSTYIWDRVFVMSKEGSGPVEARLYSESN